MKIQIKNHRNKNDYALSRSGHWVRDFTKPLVKGIDINNLIPHSDMNLMLTNEMKNQEKLNQKIESEEFSHPKIIIIGDGYKLDENQELLKTLSEDVVIIGVNSAFARWKGIRRMNYYVVNNPYDDCKNYLSSNNKVWPKCIASTRTSPQFMERYKGLTYIYAPVKDEVYSGINNDLEAFVDDYRNPVCAAIALAFRFKVKKLLLLSLLEMYEQKRPATDKVKDLWIYPQQRMAHALIDTNLYWLQKVKIDVGHIDECLDYQFATYISKDSIKRFFNDRT